MFPIADGTAAANPTGLSEYIGVVRHRKYLAIGVFALVFGLGFVWLSRQAPIYVSSVSLAVRSPLDATLNEQGQSVDPRRALRNEIEFITSDLMAKEVDKRLDETASLSVVADEEADVIEIRASGPDPEVAAATANTFAETYKRLRIEEVLASNEVQSAEIEKLLFQTTTQINEINKPLVDLDRALASLPLGPERDVLQQQRSALANSSQAQLESLLSQQQAYQLQLDNIGRRSEVIRSQGIRTLQEGSVPDSPEGGSRIRDLVLFAVVAALCAAAAVALAEHFDDTIKNQDALDRIISPVLGVIPVIGTGRAKGTQPIVTLSRPQSSEAESFRSLRTSVQFIGIQQKIKILQVTSPLPGEGKSITAVNLGVVLARAGDRVLLISGDLRRPSVERYLDIDSERGITSILLGEVAPQDAIVAVPEVPGLSVLPTGALPPNPSELLAWQRTEDLVRSVAEGFTVVIVDSPPVVPITDALVTARFCDATLVVARTGKTSRRRLNRCIELLRLVEANVIGSVLNAASSDEDTSPYGYGYNYRYTSNRPVQNEAAVGSEPAKEKNDSPPVVSA